MKRQDETNLTNPTNPTKLKKRSQLNVCISYYDGEGSLIAVETLFIKSNMTLGTLDLFARRRAEAKEARTYNVSFAWFKGGDEDESR